ncbi:MAG TPA: hypothetical protein VF164_09475 [Trueperaceae bacterium]
MDRSEALARLSRSTRFQFVGERLVVRDVALLEAIAEVQRVEEETGVAAGGEAQVAPRYELFAA